jgi:putative ABC transport system permease protein
MPVFRDLRYSIRTLARKPGFTVTAVATLALGIGATSAVFSVASTILLRPLPYKDPGKLVMIEGSFAKMGMMNIGASTREFVDYRDECKSFEGIAAFRSQSFNLTGVDVPERVQAAQLSAGLFELLGAAPLFGRTINSEDTNPGSENIAVISYALWQRNFGSAADAAGKTIELDGRSYSVVGIMPAGFQFPHPDMRGAAAAELWTPLTITPADLARRSYDLRVIGRIKQGTTFERAAAEMEAIGLGFIDRYPKSYRGPNGEDGGWGVSAIRLRDEIAGGVKPALLILLGAVGFVLLIACATVANLLLARGVSRRKEIAIRLALGAARARLVRELLTESLVLAFLGGAIGLVLSLWSNDLIVAIAPSTIPRIKEIGVDWRVLCFTVAVSLLTAVVFGLLPAFESSNPNLIESLREVDRSGGIAGARLRNLMVVSEVALALVLLIGAGLMIRSYSRLKQANPGFNSANLMTAGIALPSPRYAEPGQQAAFFRRLLEAMNSSPEVIAAGVSTHSVRDPFSIEGRPFGVNNPTVARHRVVSAGFFGLMGVPLDEGREFTEGDTRDSAAVSVINESLAKTFFPGEDPIGNRIKVGAPGNPSPWRRIVGVVADFSDRGRGSQIEPELFFAESQSPASTMTLIARSASGAEAAVPVIRQEVAKVDPVQPVSDVRTMEEALGATVSVPRFNMALLGVFAAVATMLAMFGIYGVVSYAVGQRTREIGIRMALGAGSGQVFKTVCKHGALLAAVGIVMGLPAAFALVRLMSTLLYGVTATDPFTFAAMPLLLGAVAILATALPARRATKIDPMAALREE